MSKVEIALVTVVEEDSVGNVFLQTKVKRNGLVNGIFSLGITGRVRIPIDKRTAALIKTGGFLAQAVEVFVKAKSLCSSDKYSGLGIELQIIAQAFRIVNHRLLVCIDKAVCAGVAEIDQ